MTRSIAIAVALILAILASHLTGIVDYHGYMPLVIVLIPSVLVCYLLMKATSRTRVDSFSEYLKSLDRNRTD